ncbi:hypothetical protein KIN20_011800 [Parelaphostrongylus tenuis]|uniref:Protein kinase domain-containing protein n=1 Tax=Parelaphostrongylus tenuis TaxID=148309 RepID=A0AAD5MEJ8_PARTN|nr:hypothetical protein KIN20_011800 [Parelaphostrongylus tenuis]
MELVGKSLADLKALRPNKVFTVPNSMGAGIECLEACEDLHKHGFIPRDLKPANYACGLGDKKRVVYILDFGIARKITNVKGELKTPRESVRFKGTIRFAAIACHKNLEMGPKDDCESWFYSMLVITISGGLFFDRAHVAQWLEDAALGGVPCIEELSKMLDYTDSLKNHDHVDYDYIYKLLEQVRKI